MDVMSERGIETEQDEIDIEDPELLADLDAAMEEAERGEGTDAFEFLRQLRYGTWRDEDDLDKALATRRRSGRTPNSDLQPTRRRDAAAPAGGTPALPLLRL